MNVEQQRALAIARARVRAKQKQANAPKADRLPEATNTLGDVVKSGASGVARGALDLAGLPGTIGDALDGGMEWLLRKGYGLATGEAPSPEGGAVERFFAGGQRPGNPLSGEVFKDAASKATDGATAYEPQTTAGEYASTIGEFLPGAAAFGGLNPGNLARFGVLPGAASEGAGQLTEGTAAEPYARVLAALAAPGIPALASRLVTPLPASAERLKMAAALKREGVDLTAGQKTGSNALRYAESELGGGKAAAMMERQGEQFTGAALKRAGINADRATPGVIDSAFSRIGQQFDDLATRNNLVADGKFVADLRQTFKEYGELVPESARAPIVESITNDIVKSVQTGGGLKGDAYKALSSRLGRASRSAKADPELSQALTGLKGALDDAMERSMVKANSPDVGAWREARNQYRNMIVLEKAATGAGENAALGIISPAQLKGAATQQSRRGYARGQGDFAELARAGEATMKPLANSGTASRTAVRNLGIPFATSGIGGALAGIPGALAGAAIPALAGRALLSGPGKAYLGNQMMKGVPLKDPRYAAIVAALLGRGGGDRQSQR